ncbi:MAG: FG-GAP-like repeat-containing protein [Acidobacteriia bacterium]|nr:FG-GAP-like repeat-containing protein [Terriglobia bacterium]
MRQVAAGIFVIAALATTAGVLHTESPPAFVEAGPAAGLDFRFHNSPTSRKYLIETMGGGVAIFDFDNDGWPDVFFVNGAALKDPQPDGQVLDKSAPEFWNRLFHNNHDGTFTDVTVKAGLQGAGYGMGVATGDFDNDGFTDLLVTTYGGAILYRNNGDGTFTDVTAKSGIKTSGWTTGAGFFDYNKDGCLDLVVCRYMEWDFNTGGMFCGVDKPSGRAYCHPDEFRPASNYLFRNNCNGTFTDASQASGIGAAKGKALGLAFGDYNNDGWLDFYIANDSAPQMLFRNNGDGTFTDVALSAGVAYNEDGKTFSGMGTVIADVDNDGLPDILTTALPYEYFAFFRNTGKGQFNYASVSAGLSIATRPYGGWGIHVFDYDNDTANEIFLANGHVMDNIEVTQPHLHTLQPPLLLKYAGNKFVNISAAAGEVFTHAWSARGAAFGDLDNDGDIDIVVTDYHGPAHFLRNEGGNRNHWIGLDLRGTRSNRDAIGAQVRLTSGAGKVQYAMVSTAGSYLSASDRRVYFGLGQEQAIREIRIQWPSGIEQVVHGPKPEQILKIMETAQSSAASPAQIQPLKSDAQQKFELGFSLARQGKNAEAIEAFREAVHLNPDLIEAHFSLGVLLARQGREHYGEAMQQFLEVLRLHPRDVDAHVNISNLLEEEGDFAASVTAMQKAVTFAPESAELYVMLGQKQDKAGQYPAAAESFRHALKSGRQPPGAHFGLGMALKHLRKFDEAAQEFETVLRLTPADPVAHFELGWLLAEQGHTAEAAMQLEEAARLQPGMAEAYAELGRVYRDLNRPQDSEAAFRKAILLKSDQVSALYGLARKSQDPQDARQLFARIRELKTHPAESAQADDLNAQGVRLMAQGRLDDALAAFRHALDDNPNFALAAYNMGVVLAHKGQMREAAEALRTAIRLRPGFSAPHFALGLVLKASGDPAAEGELRTAQMLDEVTRPQGEDAPRR